MSVAWGEAEEADRQKLLKSVENDRGCVKTLEAVAGAQQQNRRLSLSKISDTREACGLNQSCARTTRRRVFTQPRSKAELARRIKVPTNRVTEIINGQRAITGDTALRLGHFFGASAQFWLNLQTIYDLRLAEQKAGKSIKALPKLKRTA